ncbi:hypothetical protein [Kribbella deserti]|uniref:Uncharacterized protein n=1 Tax=Kribbella deserti TaxID=1926257 RepID=A0ABV6QDH8_9ACTN
MRIRSSRRVLVLAVVVALVAATTAIWYVTRRAPGGPLSLGAEGSESTGGTCLGAAGRTDYSAGRDIIWNSGRRTARITGISLVEPDGVEIAEAFLVPISPHDAKGAKVLPGITSGWPPKKLPGVGWDRRTAAVGAEIPPAKTSADDPATVDLALVLHLRRTVAVHVPAGYKAVRMEYSVGKRRFADHSSMWVRFGVKTCERGDPED